MSIELPTSAERLLVTDFDGAMTASDFFELAWERLDTRSMPDYWGQYEAGQRTHFEALAGIFSHLRGGEAVIAEIARQTQFDPLAARAIERLRAAGWDVVVVSAGCKWYIDRLLDEAGIQVAVVSNPGRIGPAGELQMLLPADSPFFHPQVGVDKSGVVRWALENFRDVAFAGDGRPDEPAARLTSPRRRFARGWLRRKFESDGTPFRPFDRWHEVADSLLAEAGE